MRKNIKVLQLQNPKQIITNMVFKSFSYAKYRGEGGMINFNNNHYGVSVPKITCLQWELTKIGFQL